MANNDFPIPLDNLLASVSEMLKQDGRQREIAILVGAEASGQYVDEDYNLYQWRITLVLDIGFYATLRRDKVLEEAAEIIADAARPFFIPLPEDNLRSVLIVPRAGANERWKAEGEEFISGKGITNQGRVRSDNPASLQKDGLLFRSQQEINLYLALKKLGVTFAPLPVFLRGGQDYRRLEPDFIIIKDGVMMVVEVDSDTYHRESPADAHARLQPLDHEGAKIERVKADECGTPEKAKACAERLMKILEKRISQRG